MNLCLNYKEGGVSVPREMNQAAESLRTQYAQASISKSVGQPIVKSMIPDKQCFQT